MLRVIPEADWRQFKKVHAVLLERFCQTAIEDLARILQLSEETPGERFLRAYKMLKDRQKQMARVFDDYRRSTAILQLGAMRLEGLLTDGELQDFSEETRQSVEALASIYRGDSTEGRG